MEYWMDALKTQHSNTPIFQRPIPLARLASEIFSLQIDFLNNLLH
jgi:hypothetical protein